MAQRTGTIQQYELSLQTTPDEPGLARTGLESYLQPQQYRSQHPLLNEPTCRGGAQLFGESHPVLPQRTLAVQRSPQLQAQTTAEVEMQRTFQLGHTFS